MKVTRFDASKMTNASSTDEGYIRADAIVTRSGIFNYMNADGSIARELRHPDEVFSADSLNSMHMIPITNGHPESKLVHADNAKELSIGHVGQNIKADGKYVVAPLMITDGGGVSSVKAGRKELSLGYTADIDHTPGIYDGQQYDSQQKNIRYNHLAIVDQARAGSEARINLDSADAVQVINDNVKEEKPVMNKVIVDGIQYDAAPEVINAYNKAQDKNKELKNAHTELKTKLDAATNEVDKLKGERDGVQAKLDALAKQDHKDTIKAAVKERVILIETAKKALAKDQVEKLDSMDNIEIKKSVILAVSPKVDLSDKTDPYIDARFDAAVEQISSQQDYSGARLKISGQVNQDDGNQNLADPLASRQNMINKQKEFYMGDKK